ncbi:MAG: M56 family metallopeptidase [Planctomycetota bacterium]|jgi:beta-lactamase regulating signal transducer with metallopeptidase domain
MSSLMELLDSDFCGNLVAALLHSLWQGIAVAGVLLLFLKSRAAKEANARYVAGLVALGAIVLCGLLTWAILDYGPVKPADETSGNQPSETTVATGTHVESTEADSFVVSETFAPEGSSPRPVESNWQVWLICAWLTGVVVMLLRTVYIAVGGSRLVGQATALEDQHILDIVEQLRRGIGITRRIRVAVSERILVPGVIGCFWPTLLLPVSIISGVPADDLRAILAHELAHVRRYDYLVNFFQMVVEAILFFNPAVWWISRQIRVEREACCDNAGLTVLGQRIRYAEVLADWARRLNEGTLETSPAVVAFGEAREDGHMLERVRRILVAGHRPRLKVSWYIAAATLVLSFAILIGLWRGTTMTVGLAARLLTPQERIDKIKQIAQTYEPEEPEYGPEDRLQLSGTLRIADGSKLPEKTQFVIHGFRPRHNSSIGTGVPKDGNFSTSIEYYNKVLFRLSAPG